MSYATIEAAVATVIIKHADYSTANCVRGDFSLIKKGPSRAVTLTYGGHREEGVTIQGYLHVWTTNIDLLVPWPGLAPTLETNFATERQKIIDQLHLWPALDACSGVVVSEIINANTPEPLGQKKGRYRGQRLFLETKELVTPTREE